MTPTEAAAPQPPAVVVEPDDIQIVRPFVEKIEAAHVKSIEAVMSLADTLIEARKALKPRGLFYRIFSDAKDPLPGCSVSMSSATADKITSIRERKALSDPSTWKGLPAAWTTLYELSPLSVADVRRLVKQGTITPDITVKEARGLAQELYPTDKPAPKPKPAEQPDQSVTIVQGRTKRDGFTAAWDGGHLTAEFRTLDEAMTFVPCSMDPDKIHRTVTPTEQQVTTAPEAVQELEALAPQRPGDSAVLDVETTKLLTREIKKIQAKSLPVSPEDHAKMMKAVDSLREALESLAPRWQCEECGHVFDPDTDYGTEPEPIYECGECGEQIKGESRCEQCNKFAAKLYDEGCPEDNCYGEMVQVGWETVAEQIAKQQKAAADDEAEEKKKRAEQEKFEKSPAGKKAAKLEADRKAAEEAEELKEREDETLALAAVITRARAEGKTVKDVRREDKRVAEVDRLIEHCREQNRWYDGKAVVGTSGMVIGSVWIDMIKGLSKAERARFEAAKAAATESRP